MWNVTLRAPTFTPRRQSANEAGIGSYSLLHDIILRQLAKRALLVEDTRLGWRSEGQAPMLLVGIRKGTDSLKQ
jgi:hypothetical protein